MCVFDNNYLYLPYICLDTKENYIYWLLSDDALINGNTHSGVRCTNYVKSSFDIFIFFNARAKCLQHTQQLYIFIKKKMNWWNCHICTMPYATQLRIECQNCSKTYFSAEPEPRAQYLQILSNNSNVVIVVVVSRCLSITAIVIYFNNCSSLSFCDDEFRSKNRALLFVTFICFTVYTVLVCIYLTQTHTRRTTYINSTFIQIHTFIYIFE